MMERDSIADSPPATKVPLELKHSDVKFVIFGYQNRKSEIYAKSEDAPLELFGSYPLEAIEISSRSRLQFLWDLIGFSSRPVQWIMSLPFRVVPESSGSERLVLVWQGLATRDEKLAIKEVLDRNAIDIAEAAMLADYWRSVISVSPVIAVCQRAKDKNRRVRVTLGICAAILILVLSLSRC